MGVKHVIIIVIAHARLPEKNFRFLIMLRNKPR